VKAHWDPDTLVCLGCNASEMKPVAEQDGEYVMWCPNCGTLLTANAFDPISASDWHTTTVANKIDGSSTRWRPRPPRSSR